MPQTSNPLYEIVNMSEAVPVIFEHNIPVGGCDCWNNIYDTHDPDCVQCRGTGQILIKEDSRLSKAVMKSTGGVVDDDDPIAHAYTFDDDISLGDIIICQGQRYKVIELDQTTTLSRQKVTVCGLDYERNYNHPQADLERYK